MNFNPVAEIHLGRLVSNYRYIKTLTGSAAVMPVVKANAYGHGMIAVASALQDAGADGLCVALAQEVKSLIDSGIDLPILHLGRIHKELLEYAGKRNVWVTISSFEDISLLKDYSVTTESPVTVHLKIDTGMGRMGVMPDDALTIARQITRIHNVNLAGVWSHPATAEEPESDYFRHQLKLFVEVLQKIKNEIPGIRHAHFANSAAIIRYPESHFSMVRPGLAIYGVSPPGMVVKQLKPVMVLKAPVSLVKDLPAGSSVGYNRTFTMKEDGRIAIVQAGYADGMRTEFSNKIQVWHGDTPLRVVGKISMDQFTVDVTDHSIATGDMITIWGGGENSLIEYISRETGRIPYELMVAVSSRVKRIYVKEKQQSAI